MPLLLIPSDMFRLPAEMFTAPLNIFNAFCVTVLLKFTVPVYSVAVADDPTVVVPAGVVVSVIVPEKVIALPVFACKYNLSVLYMSFKLSPALLPLKLTSLASAVTVTVPVLYIAPPWPVTVLPLKIVSVIVAVPLLFIAPPFSPVLFLNTELFVFNLPLFVSATLKPLIPSFVIVIAPVSEFTV